jgi:hypothetical protein
VSEQWKAINPRVIAVFLFGYIEKINSNSN